MSIVRWTPQRRDRRGQVLPIFALFIVVLLGITAMVVDTGRGWVMKRELQRTADAAALAGAAKLPDQTAATAAANDYLNRNPLRDGTIGSTSITFACVAPGIGCSPYNAVRVTLTSSAATTFAKVMGVSTMNAQAKSVAMYNQPKKFDIMIVIDRTGSMNDNSKITNAKNAVNSFLTMIDPAGVNVGLTMFPPAASNSNACTAVSGTGATQYNAANAKWTPVTLRNDYATNGVLNAGSLLVSQVSCMRAGGNTHYQYGLRKAKAELDANGRADAQDVIIFLTDGAANITPSYGTANEKRYPCGSSVTEASGIKGAGVRIFAIAYNVTDSGCLKDVQTYSGNQAEGANPLTTVQNIASAGDYYYQPSPSSLTTIFRDIAGELGDTKTKMRDDDD